MNKAILLDRDGVVIQERGAYNYLPEHVSIVEGIEKFMQTYRDKGFEFIIISNQGGIERGYYEHSHVKELHRIIAGHLASYGIFFRDWFYCPHHDKVSKCLCRKPGSLMIEKALAKHRLDLKNSLFIGDKDTDVEAGKKAGVHTLRITPNDDLNKYYLGI